MTRAVPVAAVLLGVLLVIGGAAALAVRSNGGQAPAGPPDTGVGSSEVQLSPDAGRHRAAEDVRSQLQRHYDAINERNYEAWRQTVVPARADALPEDVWRDAYATTRDGSIHVARIDPGPDGGLLVRVRFVSTQSLEDAPTDLRAERICWRSTLLMRGAPPRIDKTKGGSSARDAC